MAAGGGVAVTLVVVVEATKSEALPVTLKSHKPSGYTPPKINIEPENHDLEDDFPLPGVYSQVPC